MATSFPGALDTFADVPTSQAASPSHSTNHNDERAAIVALETAVGSTTQSRLVQRFATTTARDAAITSPVAGMVCWTTTPLHMWVYRDSTWKPFAHIQAGADSVALNGSGVGTITFDEAFPDTNYSLVMTCGGTSTESVPIRVTKSAGSCTINVFLSGSALTSTSRTVEWQATYYG